MDPVGAYFRKCSQMSVKAAWLLPSRRGMKIPARSDLHQSVDDSWDAPPLCEWRSRSMSKPGKFGATAGSTVLVNSPASLAKMPFQHHQGN